MVIVLLVRDREQQAIALAIRGTHSLKVLTSASSQKVHEAGT